MVPVAAANILIQDWKTGNHLMGPNVPKYEPDAPKLEDADVSKFPLQASAFIF